MYYFTVSQCVEILAIYGKLPPGPKEFYINLLTAVPALRQIYDEEAQLLAGVG